MNSVETILLNNIDGANSLFVFPTEISLSGWADHLLKLNGGTISMNKFIAWDEFKQNSIKSKVKNKRSIPSASTTVSAVKAEQSSFTSCITPFSQYTEQPPRILFSITTDTFINNIEFLFI